MAFNQKNPPWQRNAGQNIAGMQTIVSFPQAQPVFNQNMGLQQQQGLSLIPQMGLQQQQMYSQAVQYPTSRPMNAIAFQNQPQAQPSPQVSQSSSKFNPNQRVFSGTGHVTKVQNDFGFIDEEVFFHKNVCKGSFPKVNDRVLVEAAYNQNMPFKWNATRVQVLQSSSAVGGGSSSSRHVSSYGASQSSGGDRSGRGRYSPARKSPDRHGGHRSSNHDSRQRDEDDDRRRRRDDRDVDRYEKRDRSPERDRRERERSPVRKSSPKRRKVRPIPRYMVQMPKQLLTLKNADILELRRRYNTLYIPSDFFLSEVRWVDSFPPNQPFSIRKPCAFHVMHKDVEPLQAEDVNMEPADADYLYSAKVMLMSTPAMAEFYQKCFATAEERERYDDERNFAHPTRLINFLVGIRGKNETMAIGGPWSPSLDGENPHSNPNVLIKTAIRTCKGLTGIDLSNCTRWYRFVELYYRRSETYHKGRLIPARVEQVVIFLPDVRSCQPTQPEWDELRLGYKSHLERIINSQNSDSPVPAESSSSSSAAAATQQPSTDADKSASSEAKPAAAAAPATSDDSSAAAPTAAVDSSKDDAKEAPASDKASEPSESTTDGPAKDKEAADKAEPAEDKEKDNDEAPKGDSDQAAVQKAAPTNFALLDVKKLKVAELKAELEARNLATDDFLVVPRVTSNLPVVEIDARSWPLPPGLQFADPTFHSPGEIDMIIGNEMFFDLIKAGRVKIGRHGVTLAETELGWVVSGSVPTRKARSYPRVCQLNRYEEKLNETMSKFWEIENVEVARSTTAAEDAVEEHFKTTHSRDDTGRYVVRLPFNGMEGQLGDSREFARKRLDKLMLSLAKNPAKRGEYFNFLDEYLALGHMKEVTDVTDGGYYIPHHAVYKASSSTTKTRVVFDASARTTTGVALNDTVSVGPTVQNDLISIILRFCVHPVVLTADIPKMYRQVRLHPDDCKFQRILWWDHSGNLKTFELQTVTYGVASSPHHATRVLIQLATDEGKEFCLATQVIKKDSYIDDFLTGGSSAEAVIQVYKELSELLRRGGFGVHKFCSNSAEVLQEIPDELQEKQVSFEEAEANNSIKTLGLIWNPKEDYFVFRAAHVASWEVAPTKRKVLSEIGQLFDPLGFLGPIITSAKLVMQDVWRLGVDWDEELPEELMQRWKLFRQQLPIVNQMRKSRCVTQGEAVSVELHGFSDASLRAYGAVVYIRTITKDGTIKVSLVASKSRVAPLKPSTVPRLELCGAKLLAELVHKVVSAMQIEFDDVRLWCDSQIVLCWLKRSPLTLNQFVANRVAATVELTQGYRWGYVRSEENPADAISRGELPNDLLQKDLWWHGSPMLWQPQVTSSAPESLEDLAVPEVKPAKVLAVVKSDPPIVLNRLSVFRRMQRAWVYVHRYVDYKVHRKREFGPITASEIKKAERSILWNVQQESFGDLLKALKSGSTQRHALRNLAPFLGDDGLIRVGGRLKYSAIPYDGKHQVLLPERHHVTEAIVRELHEKHLHVGQNGLLAIVREQYWPVRAQLVIKSVVSKCQTCAKVRPKPGEQLMGNLPASRVNPAPPFSKVGIDYAGPIMLRLEGRSTKLYKAYVVVFICMVVKAIHFELVSNLSTGNFIAALQRFAGDYGVPDDIFSDNGTTFVGADHELAALKELFESQHHNLKLNEYCITKGIRWHFIPPRSPHFGGIWEAGVKSMKYHLKRVVGETRLTYEEMTTFLAQTKAILNSRPLFPMSEDPSDYSVLTPSHFLIGRPAVAIPNPSLEQEKVGRLSRWQHVQLMQEHFWRRWSQEYLHHLQGRQKWNTEVKEYKVGALVVLIDDNAPPQQWRRGRIVAVHPGEDGAVRVVTVRTTSGEYKRAVAKIALMPSVET